jgi:hypothetical protein
MNYLSKLFISQGKSDIRSTLEKDIKGLIKHSECVKSEIDRILFLIDISKLGTIEKTALTGLLVDQVAINAGTF